VHFIVNDVEYNEESVGLRQKSPELGMYSLDFEKEYDMVGTSFNERFGK